MSVSRGLRAKTCVTVETWPRLGPWGPLLGEKGAAFPDQASRGQCAAEHSAAATKALLGLGPGQGWDSAGLLTPPDWHIYFSCSP